MMYTDELIMINLSRKLLKTKLIVNNCYEIIQFKRTSFLNEQTYNTGSSFGSLERHRFK